MKINEVESKESVKVMSAYRAQAKDYMQLMKIFMEEGFTREEAFSMTQTIVSAWLCSGN